MIECASVYLYAPPCFPREITCARSPVAVVSSAPLPPRPRPKAVVELFMFMFIPVWNTGRPSLSLFRGLDHLNDIFVSLGFMRCIVRTMQVAGRGAGLKEVSRVDKQVK